MRIDDPSQLSDGMTVYKVSQFGAHGVTADFLCTIAKYEIVAHSHNNSSRAASNSDINWWTIKRLCFTSTTGNGKATSLIVNSTTKTIDEKYDAFYDGHVEECSMQDAGIIPNTYNKHQVFDDLDDAKEYGCGELKVPFTRSTPEKTESKPTCDYERAMKIVDW